MQVRVLKVWDRLIRCYQLEEKETMEGNRKIRLTSSDGKAFKVDELVALESQLIKRRIETGSVYNGIYLPNVTSKILSKVIKYCKKHVEASKSGDRTATAVDDDLKAWDAKFVKVDPSTLFDIMLAAFFLDINSLLDLTCQTVAEMIKYTPQDEIHKVLNIKRNLTAEEEEQVRRENPWAFE